MREAREGDQMDKVRACRVCGCTDDQACETDQGPCSWVDKDLCSACVVDLPPVHHIIAHKTCRNCQRLIADSYKDAEVYTCSLGRFDDAATPRGEHRWFAKSGILQPNRRVKQAQAHCSFFDLRGYKVVLDDPRRAEHAH